MIEVRIDIDHMQRHQHNVMHSILMMNALREAGIPVIGKIIFNGPERGKLISWREQDLDSDTWVVRWYDDDEDPTPGAVAWVPVSNGSGKGFIYTNHRNGALSTYKPTGNQTLPAQQKPTTTPGASDWDREDDDL